MPGSLADAHARERGAEPTLGVIGKLYEAGRHGMKNGKGFFDWDGAGNRRLWSGLAELLPALTQQPDIAEVKARILYAQLAEGARAFAEGVLPQAIDGDLGATLGVGFPAWLGGPFAAIDTLGVAAVVAECDRLTQRYGSLYAAPDLLRAMADSGQTFHGDTPVASPGAVASAG